MSAQRFRQQLVEVAAAAIYEHPNADVVTLAEAVVDALGIEHQLGPLFRVRSVVHPVEG